MPTPDSSNTSKKGGKKKENSFWKGSPCDTPCEPCVQRQLQNVGSKEKVETCCIQATEHGKAKACYHCRSDKLSCKALDKNEPAVQAWADVQRNPGAFDDEETMVAAFRMKEYTKQKAATIPTALQSHYESLKALADSTSTMANMTVAYHEKKFGPLPDEAPKTLGGKHSTNPHDQAKIESVQETRDLNDAMRLAAEFVKAASEKVTTVAINTMNQGRNIETGEEEN